jgi:hypothetical protein
VGRSDHFFRSVGVGIAYKDLTELVFIYQGNDLAYPLLIEFVKYIVKKEQGRYSGLGLQEIELRQFQGD